MAYPDTEGFGYSFERGELSLNRKLYTAISNVEADQPTEEEGVPGTRAYPLKRGVGRMNMGEGTVTFTDEEERTAFILDLGENYREKTWTASWVLTAPGKPPIKYACYGCRILSNPVSHEGGAAALGGDITFSFMYMTVNGRRPHSGLPNLGN